MPKESQTVMKFRPDRPIFLNEQNTNLKTRDEVEFAVEKLRSRNWLCAYGEKSRPLSFCFAEDKMRAEFNKDCSAIGLTIKNPIIKPDDFEAMEAEDAAGVVMPEAEATDTHEDPSGKIHINAK